MPLNKERIQIEWQEIALTAVNVKKLNSFLTAALKKQEW